MRSAYDNYELEQELRKHWSSERRGEEFINDHESKRMKLSMRETYLRIQEKHQEMEDVNYHIRKLDKRISYLNSKAGKLQQLIQLVGSENNDLCAAMLSISANKLLNSEHN